MEGQLEFERIEDVSVLSNFFCGVAVMDDFIHRKDRGLQYYIDNSEANTILVKMNNEIVAFFSIIESCVIFDEDSIDDMKHRVASIPENAFENPDFFNKKEFPAIEIAYLAVEKTKRCQGIGRAIIMEIAEKAGMIVNGCEFIKVDAYCDSSADSNSSDRYSAVGFYTKVGFDKQTVVPQNNLWPMVYVINPHEYNADEDE